MIIGICGLKRVGKDTLADYIVSKYNFVKYSLGDPVKETCRHLFGFTDEQLYGDLKDTFDENLGISPREAFQKIGTEFGRNYIHSLFPNLNIPREYLWCKHFENWYLQNKNKNIIITDVRLKNELYMIKKLGGICIYIQKNEIEYKSNNHQSEQINTWDKSLFDIILNNNKTIKDLYDNFDTTFIKV